MVATGQSKSVRDLVRARELQIESPWQLRSHVRKWPNQSCVSLGWMSELNGRHAYSALDRS